MEASMRLEAVSASYDGKPALQDVSLTIPSRRITAIIGPSGCGKSTLLRCMNGLLSEEPGAKVTGEIFLGDRPISALPREELRRRVGLVFQTPSPFPFSIYRNMTYAPRYYGVRDKRRLEAIAVEKLQMAGLYDEVREDLGKSALKLSGGQQQRVSIARALAGSPSVILADEPTGALDSRTGREVLGFLKKLNREGDTVVLITHDNSIAVKADRIVRLQDGKIIYDGDAHDPRAVVRPEEMEQDEPAAGGFSDASPAEQEAGA